jgi:hypothetical protein
MSPAIAECVLILAVCFNAILAVLNGHGVTLQRGHVAFVAGNIGIQRGPEDVPGFYWRFSSCC